MSYNGSGTFIINSTGQPVVTGTVISSSVFNALTADLATGLSTAITKDGQTTITNNIPFNGYKITNLGAGTASTDAARVGQLQSGATTAITVAGTDTYTGTMSPALAAYGVGNVFTFVVPNTNTSSCTLNIDGLGAKSITRDGSTALIAGDLVAGSEVVVVYDGTRFQVLNSNSKTNFNVSTLLKATTLNLTNALGTSYGGTGLTSFTANGVVYASSSSALATGSALTWDGSTTLNVASTLPVQQIIGSASGQFGLLLLTGTPGSTASIGGITYNSSTGEQRLHGNQSYVFQTFYAGGSEQMRLTSTGLGIGTSSPAKKLDVNGDALINGLTVGRGAGNGGTNTVLGVSALGNVSQSGAYTTALGDRALYSNTSGSVNTAVGSSVLYNNTTGFNNSAFGYAALYTNTTGSYNVAVGLGALQLNTTASNNTAVGYQAGYSNTTGYSNVFAGTYSGFGSATGYNNTYVGYSSGPNGVTNASASYNTGLGQGSLTQLTTGYYNVGIGNNALGSNTTASGSTAVGYQAGYSNTTGASNTAVGLAALYSNTTASGNAAFGAYALYANTTGTGNSAFGSADNIIYTALRLNTTGSYNSAFGLGALGSNTTASNNTAVGYGAAYTNQTGTNISAVGYQAAYNTNTTGYVSALGYQAAYSNTTGYNNVAVGVRSLYSNTSGTGNIAVGDNSLNSNTTGYGNVAVGTAAFYTATTATYNTAIGNYAGYYNTTGVSNTFLGAYAGYYVTSGSNNTIIGEYNGNQGGLDIRTANNYIVLSDGNGNPRMYMSGAGLYCPEVYSVTGAATANVYVDLNGNLYRATSSLKYKTDVQDAVHGLSDLMKLRPVTYKSKKESESGLIFGGLIAEEVHEAGLVEFVQYANDGTPDALSYSNMVSLCIKAIQEQQALIASLTARVAQLESR